MKMPHRPATLTRRDILRRAGALSLLAATGWSPAVAAEPGRVPYGAGLYWPDFVADPRLGEAIVQWCSRITPVTELKFKTLRPTDTAYDFTAADAMAAFAAANGLAMHGHTLVWYADLPDWVQAIPDAAGAEALMAEHIETVMTRYPAISSWDVVNEAIPDVAHSPSDRRDGFWMDRLGASHIGLAFKLAHQVDPAAQLVLNEYDIEFAIEHAPAKRAAFRHLILELLDRDIPVHAIGLQAHLRGGWPIATEELAAFVSEMRGHGLDILVTELDVMDQDLPSPAAERDAVIAAQVHDFLSAVSAGGAPSSITTWGIADPYSWVRWAYPRSDGTANRPLPLDAEFRPKPFMDIIDSFRTVAA